MLLQEILTKLDNYLTNTLFSPRNCSHYVIREGEGGFTEMLMFDYGGRGGVMRFDDISKLTF